MNNKHLSKEIKLYNNILVERLKNGDSSGLRLIFNNYRSLFTTIARSYSKNPEIVQDLVQEGITKIYYNINKYKNNGSFEGWMKKIVTNYCIDYTRSSRYKQDVYLGESSFSFSYGGMEISDSSNPEEKMIKKDLESLIQQLPKGYGKVLKMYAIQGYSHKEIGAAMGIAASSSRSQLVKAKQKLKRLMLANGGY